MEIYRSFSLKSPILTNVGKGLTLTRVLKHQLLRLHLQGTGNLNQQTSKTRHLLSHITSSPGIVNFRAQHPHISILGLFPEYLSKLQDSDFGTMTASRGEGWGEPTIFLLISFKSSNVLSQHISPTSLARIHPMSTLI